MSRRAGGGMGPRTLLLILAVASFAVGAFGIDIDVGSVNFAGLGLMLFAASFIFP